MLQRQRRASSGFTMVELMVTIAILAIVMAIAYPSFIALVRSNRLSSGANELVAAFQLARSEAVRLNRPVSVCRTADGSACAGAAGENWAQWIVASSGGNVIRSYTTDTQLRITANPALKDEIRFGPNGLATSAGALVKASINVCIPATAEMRTVVVSGGSQARIERTSGSGTCAAPGNPP